MDSTRCIRSNPPSPYTNLLQTKSYRFIHNMKITMWVGFLFFKLADNCRHGASASITSITMASSIITMFGVTIVFGFR